MSGLEPLLAVSETVWQAISAAMVTVIIGYMQFFLKKLDGISKNVEVVHKNTNSLVDKLVRITSEEAHARGEQDERNRQREED